MPPVSSEILLPSTEDSSNRYPTSSVRRHLQAGPVSCPVQGSERGAPVSRTSGCFLAEEALRPFSSLALRRFQAGPVDQAFKVSRRFGACAPSQPGSRASVSWLAEALTGQARRSGSHHLSYSLPGVLVLVVALRPLISDYRLAAPLQLVQGLLAVSHHLQELPLLGQRGCAPYCLLRPKVSRPSQLSSRTCTA